MKSIVHFFTDHLKMCSSKQSREVEHKSKIDVFFKPLPTGSTAGEKMDGIDDISDASNMSFMSEDSIGNGGLDYEEQTE